MKNKAITSKAERVTPEFWKILQDSKSGRWRGVNQIHKDTVEAESLAVLYDKVYEVESSSKNCTPGH